MRLKEAVALLGGHADLHTRADEAAVLLKPDATLTLALVYYPRMLDTTGTVVSMSRSPGTVSVTACGRIMMAVAAAQRK
jgi:hypothetical protein